MPDIHSNKKRRYIISAIVGVLCIGSLLALFPGSYSVDSWNIYGQVATGVYTDWHAPVMSFTWELLNNITGQFYSLYIAQMLLYWLFVYLLLKRTHNSWAIFIAGLAFSFALLGIPQYIMKDSLMAIVWGVASVLLLSSESNAKRTGVAALVCCCLLYGLFVRINAVVPFAVLMYIFTERYLIGKKGVVLLKLLTVTGISFLALFLNNVITYNVLHAELTYPEYKLKLLDVAGISKLSGKDYMPACISSYQHYDSSKLQKEYHAASIDDLYWTPDGSASVFPIPDSNLNSCLDKNWRLAIKEHPSLYLQNRAEGFLYYLRVKKRFNEYWNMRIEIEPENPFQLTRKRNFVSGIISGMYYDISDLFFNPWLWLLLNIAFFFLFLGKYRKQGYYQLKVSALIQLSGILYTLSQFFVYQHDRDFRYTYWNVLIFFIGLVYLLVGRNKQTENNS